MAPPRPPTDRNFDPENGPEQYVDEDDFGIVKDSIALQLTRRGRTPTVGSNTSKNSKYSLKTIPKVIRRVTYNSQFTTDEDQKRPSEGRKLIEFLSRGIEPTNSFLDACDWYVRFLDFKCTAHWNKIRPFVKGVKKDALAPNEDDIAKVDKVLATIAIALSEKQNFALATPVDDLINHEMIIDDDTDERAALHQLMFTFLGWLTKLYDPRLDCKPKRLQIAKFTMTTEGNPINLRSRTFDTHGHILDEYVDEPFWLLLGRFGKPIPDPHFREQSDFAPPTEWIGVPSVCYQTLRDVCRIEIEWVDALGMHLEFDSSRKLLKLFRFPSFCRLMYKRSQSGLHSKLFDDKARDRHDETRGRSFLTNDFFREMLLTYRLLFGQDLRSSKLFVKEMAAIAKRHAKSKAALHLPPHIFALPDADPLLPLLCSLHADELAGISDLYAELNAGVLQSFYTPDMYPFFAEKLLVLQAYVKEQHPHNWHTLWNDHRNKGNWWQFWAVLFIGGGTLLLATLSLVFQIWQAVLTQQQLMQGFNNARPAGQMPGDI